MIAPLIGYAFIGIVAAVLSTVVLDDIPSFPSGAAPAVMFLVGALWPLVIACLVVYGVCWCIVQVIIGFRVLARYLRGDDDDGGQS